MIRLIPTLLLLLLAPSAGAEDRYAPAAKRIIEATLAGNKAYEKLQVLCDEIGHRLSGSKNLQRAVRWAVAAMKADGHENVRTDEVMVPWWVRGEESLVLLTTQRTAKGRPVSQYNGKGSQQSVSP